MIIGSVTKKNTKKPQLEWQTERHTFNKMMKWPNICWEQDTKCHCVWWMDKDQDQIYSSEPTCITKSKHIQQVSHESPAVPPATVDLSSASVQWSSSLSGPSHGSILACLLRRTSALAHMTWYSQISWGSLHKLENYAKYEKIEIGATSRFSVNYSAPSNVFSYVWLHVLKKHIEWNGSQWYCDHGQATYSLFGAFFLYCVLEQRCFF
jgi:hypothetical protein